MHGVDDGANTSGCPTDAGGNTSRSCQESRVTRALLDGVRTTAASADRDAHDERPELGDPWVRALNVDPGQQRRIRAIRPRTCAQTTYGGPPW